MLNTNIVKNGVRTIKNNKVAIMQWTGIGLSVGGTILGALAGWEQQKIDIAKAVEEFNKAKM